jgi:guanine deaminase
MPNFVDLHFHWVQDQVRTAPKDNLLVWLSKYTWPHEAKYADIEYSRQQAKIFSQQLLQMGTLAGACYASIHGHTVDHALEHFVGDFVVGNVLMTMNSPAYLSQSPLQACTLIDQKSLQHGRRYAITPRFAPTTHPEVMSFAAAIARKRKLTIQTHLSENKQEIHYVLEIFRNLPGFEDVATYSDIYHRCKILGARTIMGHAIHLSNDEWRLMAKTKTAIAHCPTSNAPIKKMGLGSGLFNFKIANTHKVAWALGSDIGGGPFLSMFDVMQSFVSQQKHHGANYTMALYRATVAGADILGLKKMARLQQQGTPWGNFIFVKRPVGTQGRIGAEDVLRAIHAPVAKKRDRCNHLVAKTFYKGKLLFESKT